MIGTDVSADSLRFIFKVQIRNSGTLEMSVFAHQSARCCVL